MSIENHPVYSQFNAMKKRCRNVNSKDYPYYGGRGISVCDRWLEGKGQGFRYFLVDMGDRPSASHTIDRIDVNGNYEPDNCRWATRSQQSFNRRMQSNNTSGITGVSYIPTLKRWVATYRDTTVYGGNSKEKAIAARNNAIEKHKKTIVISTNLC